MALASNACSRTQTWSPLPVTARLLLELVFVLYQLIKREEGLGGAEFITALGSDGPKWLQGCAEGSQRSVIPVSCPHPSCRHGAGGGRVPSPPLPTCVHLPPAGASAPGDRRPLWSRWYQHKAARASCCDLRDFSAADGVWSNRADAEAARCRLVRSSTKPHAKFSLH